MYAEWFGLGLRGESYKARPCPLYDLKWLTCITFETFLFLLTFFSNKLNSMLVLYVVVHASLIICHGKLFRILKFSSPIIIYIVQMCTYE